MLVCDDVIQSSGAFGYNRGIFIGARLNNFCRVPAHRRATPRTRPPDSDTPVGPTSPGHVNTGLR